MLRLGLELGSRALRPSLALHQPSFLRSTICASSSVSPFFQTRSYAKESKEVKKVKYESDKVKVKKPRFKSGTRLKRVDWLDTPRRPKNPKRKVVTRAHKLFTLNTHKRITNHVNKLKTGSKKGLRFNWLTILASQVKMTPENATELTQVFLHSPEINLAKVHPSTFDAFLDLWYRRKNVEKATEVFEAAKAHNKLTDYGYCAYVKTLATRGQLDRAKEIVAERRTLNLKGASAYIAMVNYLSANNLQEGVEFFEQVTRHKAHPMLTSLLSVVIGWALKHGDVELAEKYYQELAARHLKLYFHSMSTDSQYEEALLKFREIEEKRNTIMAEWTKALRQTNNNWKENINRADIQKLVQKGESKRPKLPKLPPMPTRLTKEEFLEQRPPALSSRMIRALIDIEQEGKELSTEWKSRLSRGLNTERNTKGIQGLAHKIFLNDKERYGHLKSLLTKVGLDAEKLTYVPPPRVKGEAPISKRKKTPAVNKWWKKDRTVFEQKE